MPRRRVPLADRFWPRVDQSGGPDACWPWTGYVNPTTGYGQVASGGQEGKALSTHVVAYTLTYGPTGPGLQVMHSCDNRPCCNPLHLSAGTQSQNIQDMWKRGRGPAPTPKKLDAATVRMIRQTKLGHRALARRLGLGEATVRDIRARRIWANIL